MTVVAVFLFSAVVGYILGTISLSRKPNAAIHDRLGKIFLWDKYRKEGTGIATLTENEMFVDSGDFDKDYEIHTDIAIAGYSYSVKKKNKI